MRPEPGDRRPSLTRQAIAKAALAIADADGQGRNCATRIAVTVAGDERVVIAARNADLIERAIAHDQRVVVAAGERDHIAGAIAQHDRAVICQCGERDRAVHRRDRQAAEMRRLRLAILVERAADIALRTGADMRRVLQRNGRDGYSLEAAT